MSEINYLKSVIEEQSLEIEAGKCWVNLLQKRIDSQVIEIQELKESQSLLREYLGGQVEKNFELLNRQKGSVLQISCRRKMERRLRLLMRLDSTLFCECVLSTKETHCLFIKYSRILKICFHRLKREFEK